MSDSGLRQRIIDVATKFFAERGYSATSIREVAEACECTKPSLYYYFENKEKLFSEVVGIHIKATDDMCEAILMTEGPTRQRIHETLDNFIHWAANNPAAMRLLQRVETQHEDGAPEINITCARELHLKIMGDAIERGQKAGEIRTGIDPLECALAIAGTISFQFEMYLATEDWDRDRLHRTVDLIFDGIAA